MKVDVAVPGPLRNAGREARRLEGAAETSAQVREGFSAHHGTAQAR
jgi:hypothetical protein